MGIQRWRLRQTQDGASTIPNTVVDAVANTAAHDHDVGASSISVLNQPVEKASTVSIKAAPSTDPFANLDWQAMQSMIETDKHCPSCSLGRSMLGSGDAQADWMFVADAPSINDVGEGQLFTGRVGQLFESMLQALNLARGDVYASSIFKCAPPNDLSVSPSCDRLLHRQMELIQPKVVIAFGEFSAQAAIKTNDRLVEMRKLDQVCLRTRVAIVPTYSLAQVLDDSSLKAAVWSDLKKCLRLLEH